MIFVMTFVSAFIIGSAATFATGENRNFVTSWAFAARWAWTAFVWPPIVIGWADHPERSLIAAAFWLVIFVLYARRWHRRFTLQRRSGWVTFPG